MRSKEERPSVWEGASWEWRSFMRCRVGLCCVKSSDYRRIGGARDESIHSGVTSDIDVVV